MGAGQSFEEGSRRGELAIVTGGAAGIGYGAAERCLWLGMDVVVADVDPSLDEAVDRLGQGAAGSCTGVVTDVSDEASVQGLAAHPAVAGRALHFLFLNAGVHNGEASFEVPLPLLTPAPPGQPLQRSRLGLLRPPPKTSAGY